MSQFHYNQNQKNRHNQDFSNTRRTGISYKRRIMVVDRSPLGKFCAWCINKTAGTVFENIAEY